MKARLFSLSITLTMVAAIRFPLGLAAQDASIPVNQAQHYHYKLIDLGTFGGPNSFVPVVFYEINGTVGARAISDRGAVAGYADTFVADPICFLDDCFYQNTFQWRDGVLTNLGTLPGGKTSISNWISANGLIAGAQVIGQSNLSGDLTFHPFFWEKGVLTDLGTFGGNNGTTNWINEDGDVVGKADLPGSQTHDGFLWKNGVMTDLGTLPGDPCSNATSINENRQIVGASSDCVNPLHAFLWENGGPMVDLNSLIPPNSSLRLVNAEDINEQGEIAGVGVPADCTNVNLCGHAFLLVSNGDCDDDCEGRIAASQNAAAPAQNAATMKQGNETVVSPLERFRSQMRQRYHIPGPPSAPRD